MTEEQPYRLVSGVGHEICWNGQPYAIHNGTVRPNEDVRFDPVLADTLGGHQ